MEVDLKNFNLFDTIKLTTVERMMLHISENRKNTESKILLARLELKAYINNSNIAEDIATITDIIDANPQPITPITSETPTLPDTVTESGEVIKMGKQIKDLEPLEVLQRITHCNSVLNKLTR